MSSSDDRSFARRFERQVRFAPLGQPGQARLGEASVLLVGCGALGAHLAQSLVRSGVGRLVLVDRDVVVESNLPRQILFDESDVRAGRLKVEATRDALTRVGGPTRIEAQAEHLDADNIGLLAEGVDLVLDGTDNLSTRYLVNDFCIDRGLPWIYGGVVGSSGLVLAVEPGHGPCLACLFPEPPPAGVLPTCETAGVLQPAVAVVAGLQAGLALRVLAGPRLERHALLDVDAWDGRVRELEVVRDPNCRACGARDLRYLRAPIGERAVRLCGRNTVQVRGTSRPDLERIAVGLAGLAHDVRVRGPILCFTVEARRVTLFADGRALIEGEDDVDRALALYDRYVGS